MWYRTLNSLRIRGFHGHEDNLQVKWVIHGLLCQLKQRPPDKRKPFTVTILHQAIAVAQHADWPAMDKLTFQTATVVAFFGCLHVSEFTAGPLSSHELCMENVKIYKNHIQIAMLSSKTFAGETVKPTVTL